MATDRIGIAPPMDLALYIPAFVTLFVIIDPWARAAFRGADARHDGDRAAQGGDPRLSRGGGHPDAVRGAGEAVLSFLGISMPAFRIAGGVLLFLTALDMLFERRAQRRQGQADRTTPTIRRSSRWPFR
jgi:multiple antibiotic resistance protein